MSERHFWKETFKSLPVLSLFPSNIHNQKDQSSYQTWRPSPNPSLFDGWKTSIDGSAKRRKIPNTYTCLSSWEFKALVQWIISSDFKSTLNNNGGKWKPLRQKVDSGNCLTNSNILNFYKEAEEMGKNK